MEEYFCPLFLAPLQPIPGFPPHLNLFKYLPNTIKWDTSLTDSWLSVLFLPCGQGGGLSHQHSPFCSAPEKVQQVQLCPTLSAREPCTRVLEYPCWDQFLLCTEWEIILEKNYYIKFVSNMIPMRKADQRYIILKKWINTKNVIVHEIKYFDEMSRKLISKTWHAEAGSMSWRE